MNDPALKINSVFTVKQFFETIDGIAREKEITYMDAVMHYCESTGMEVETAGKLIKSSAKLKARIRYEAERLHFMKKKG